MLIEEIIMSFRIWDFSYNSQHSGRHEFMRLGQSQRGFLTQTVILLHWLHWDIYYTGKLLLMILF